MESLHNQKMLDEPETFILIAEAYKRIAKSHLSDEETRNFLFSLLASGMISASGKIDKVWKLDDQSSFLHYRAKYNSEHVNQGFVRLKVALSTEAVTIPARFWRNVQQTEVFGFSLITSSIEACAPGETWNEFDRLQRHETQPDALVNHRDGDVAQFTEVVVPWLAIKDLLSSSAFECEYSRRGVDAFRHPSTQKRAQGRARSDAWPEWIAELVFLAVSKRISSSHTPNAIVDRVTEALDAARKSTISKTSAWDVAVAVAARLKAGK